MVFSALIGCKWRQLGCTKRWLGPEDPNGGAGLPPASSKAETLNYIGDIIQELKQLAEKAGYRTLAAILGAALVEARTQDDERRR
jgi:hypothetical protein